MNARALRLTISASARRISIIARLTIREAVRQRVIWGLAALAVTFVVGAESLEGFNFGAPELKFVAELGEGAVAFFGAILTVVLTVSLIFSEFENRTILTVFARPISRAEFMLGKLAGTSAAITGFLVLLLALLAAVLWNRESAMAAANPGAFLHGRIVNYHWIIWTGLLLGLKLLVLAAFSLAVASVARSQAFAMLLALSGYVIGHLQDLAAAVGNSVSGRVVSTTVRLLVPDFEVLSPRLDGIPVTARELPWLIAYAFIYVGAAAVLSTVFVERREF